MKKCAVYGVENCYLQRRDFDLGSVIGCGPGCTAQMLLHAVVDSIEIVNKARNDELTLSDSNVLLRVSHDSVRHAARCSHARLTVPWSSKYEMLQIKNREIDYYEAQMVPVNVNYQVHGSGVFSKKIGL